MGVEDDWDIVIFGDGSGSNWSRAIGWAGVVIDRASWHRELFYGSSNKGTVNVGELLPFIQGLTWWLDWAKKKDLSRQVRKVWCISDSAHTVQTGKCRDKRDIRANRGLWLVLALLEREGFELHWQHMHRATAAMNCLADHLSRQARVSLERNHEAVLQKVASLTPTDLYKINP